MTHADRLLYVVLMCMCGFLIGYGFTDDDIVLSVIAFFTALIATYDVCRH
jgi:uncharacterized membrane protein